MNKSQINFIIKMIILMALKALSLSANVATLIYMYLPQNSSNFLSFDVMV